MSYGGAITFVLLSVFPVPGIAASIPFAVLSLDYPPLLVPLMAASLAYVQVGTTNILWNLLHHVPRVHELLVNKRSKRVDRLIESGGSFWPVFLATPLLGAWMIVVFMRYANVPLRRVLLPIAASLLTVSVVITALCVYVPSLFKGS